MKVEWETKLLGMTFTGISTLKEPNWWDITNNTSLRKLGISGGENYIFLWRVRNRYDPITLPYQPHGPWIFIPWNSGGEGDVRLGPDPDPTLQDIINYILGRSHYPHDINVDAINDAADVIDFIIP